MAKTLFLYLNSRQLKYIFQIFILIAGFAISNNLYATHNRAGEITYRSLGNLSYEAKIVTYTYTPSPADRPTLDILWGDGNTDVLNRISEEYLPNDVKKNVYIGTHTYAAPSTYILSFEDPNRNGGVLNIPNSINVPFYVETELVINPFLGPNTSPELLNPPIDNGCVNQPFIHNPAAYDIDGDSLAYKIVKCKGESGLDIPNYIVPLANISFSIDSYSGDLYWNSPQQQGDYNVAIKIEEWRSGVMIGFVIRDMQISIVACNNVKPDIFALNDTCITAGETLNFTVKALDANNDLITLTSSGGPFLMPNSPATFVQPATGFGSVTSAFEWETNCSHVRKNPYNIIFKAQDNGSPVKLVDIKSMNIRIVAPAPINLLATPLGNNINLSWNSYICNNAHGFRIYRKAGSSGFTPNNCETGVPAYTGYVQIAELHDISTTSYTDNDNGTGLTHGIQYCYLIIAYYNDGSESYASNETCTSLSDDTPVITNVSITKTGVSDGSAYIAWSKPNDFDLLQFPGPYYYLLYKSNGFNGSALALVDTLHSINDTTYNHLNINTKDTSISYRIELYNEFATADALIGTSEIASSVFLKTTPSDNKVILTWTANVPWLNDTFVVYKQNPQNLSFDSIGYSTQPYFVDLGLVNGQNYCYYIKTSGEYNTTGFVHPIINNSQIKCDMPLDNEPPCAPQLDVRTNCSAIENVLEWTNPNNSCANDVVAYKIYFSQDDNQSLELLATISNPLDTTFTHNNINTIAGCYLVLAVDSFNNESIDATTICVDIDSCDLYELPNVFTPNEDGTNDLYVPFPYDFVERIEISIFNRWGSLEFKSKNPDINWDGKNYLSKQNCSDGVYYYVCDVYEYRLKGIKKRTLTGFIHLIR
ncbi:MAG: gliding motility-associated C-terminal domain-containing protein [Bacteroidota bacterium]